MAPWASEARASDHLSRQLHVVTFTEVPKLDKRKMAPKQFWTWFVKNEQELFDFERDRDRVFGRLATALHSVHRALTFEFGPVREDGRREFIVSADGIKAAFPAVRRLVEAAPQLDRWTIVAFRPPKGVEGVVRIGDITLKADDIWFEAEPDRGRVGLTLYIRGLSETEDEKLGPAAFLLLDTALGEYAVETQIGYIDRQPLPDNPAEMGLRPFREITDVIERGSQI
jgi:hypothetical protein